MREFSILKGRILQYLEMKGITKYTFYKVTGIANGILSQPNGISEESLLKFLKCYPDVNPDWLIRGEGPMLHPAGQREMVRGYVVDESVKSPFCVDDVQASYGGVATPAVAGGEDMVVRIPVRSWRQALSGAALQSNGMQQHVCLPPALIEKRGVLSCFRIEDQAMYPTLRVGSYVVCRLLSHEQWLQVHEEAVCIVALNDGRVLLRRLRWGVSDGSVVMLPDHPDRCLYPAVRLMRRDIHLLWKVECYLSVVLSGAAETEKRQLARMESDIEQIKHRLDRIEPSKHE